MKSNTCIASHVAHTLHRTVSLFVCVFNGDNTGKPCYTGRRTGEDVIYTGSLTKAKIQLNKQMEKTDSECKQQRISSN